MRRRTLLWGVLASGVARAAPLIRADTDADGFYVGVHTPAGPVLHRRIEVRRPHLFSTSDDNTGWTLWVQTDPVGNARWLFYQRDGRIVQANSKGQAARDTTATWQLDRQAAETVAAWLEIPLRERTPLGTGLRASFELVSDTTVRLTVRNDGERVGLVPGGRQRGPRNNRFHFVVFRDGEPLPELDGWDFGGRSGVEVLEAGEVWTAEEDLTRWADVSESGSYQVRCTYQAELVPGAEFARWPETAHQTWEPVWTGAVTLRR